MFCPTRVLTIGRISNVKSTHDLHLISFCNALGSPAHSYPIALNFPLLIWIYWVEMGRERLCGVQKTCLTEEHNVLTPATHSSRAPQFAFCCWCVIDFRVWSVRYNHFHDQLLLTSSSDSRVILNNIVSLSSEPFGHLDEEDDDDGMQEKGWVGIKICNTRWRHSH